VIATLAIAAIFPLKACSDDAPPDVGDPPEQLVVPSLDGIDLDNLYVEAVQRAITNDMRVPWQGHTTTVGQITPGCPDVYTGAPTDMIDGIDDDAKGLSWYDHCTAGDLQFFGFQYWEAQAHATGDPTSLEGRSIEGERMLLGDGTVSQGQDALFEFKGTASDALNRQDAPDYTRWTYTSLVDGTVTGQAAFAGNDIHPSGYRTDTYLLYTGGDVDSLEARGNIYYFGADDMIDGKFDSIALDIEFHGPTGITPDICPTEPLGWIGVRDSDAFWYDVVFEPRHDDDATDSDYPDDPYTSCDGCGNLYVRGVPQNVLVCPDLSFLWDGALTPPDADEFAYSIRDQLEDP